MKQRKGFSLIEIVVVLAIVAILAAISYPSINRFLDKSKDDAYIAEAKKVYRSASFYAAKLIARSEYASLSDTEFADKIKAASDALITDSGISDDYADDTNKKKVILKITVNSDKKITEMWYRSTMVFDAMSGSKVVTKDVHYQSDKGYQIDTYTAMDYKPYQQLIIA